MGCWTGSLQAVRFGATWTVPNCWCQTVNFSSLGLVSQRQIEANSYFLSSLSCFQSYALELWSQWRQSSIGGSGGWTCSAPSRRAGDWSPSTVAGVFSGCWQCSGETGGPLWNAAVEQMLNQDPTCPSLVVIEVASPKIGEMVNPISQALRADALNLTGTNWQLQCHGAQTGGQFAC